MAKKNVQSQNIILQKYYPPESGGNESNSYKFHTDTIKEYYCPELYNRMHRKFGPVGRNFVAARHDVAHLGSVRRNKILEFNSSPFVCFSYSPKSRVDNCTVLSCHCRSARVVVQPHWHQVSLPPGWRHSESPRRIQVGIPAAATYYYDDTSAATARAQGPPAGWPLRNAESDPGQRRFRRGSPGSPAQAVTVASEI